MRLTTALDALREIGTRRFVTDIPPWLVRRRYLFYALALSDAVAPTPSQIPFRLDPVVEDDLPRLLSVRPGFYSLPQLQTRLQQGHLAFVGRSLETIVHLRWIFVGSVQLPYLARRLVLAPGEGYLDEVYTVPAWRRKGVEGTAAYEMQRAMHHRGFRRIICAIAAWNWIPRHVAEAQGYEQVGVGDYWNILGHRRLVVDGFVRDHRDGDLSVATSAAEEQGDGR